MVYTHFGKPAEVWKHLALCSVMLNEKPLVYMETNSASASYSLSHTPEQEYGIYHFIEHAVKDKCLFESVYFQLENTAIKENSYLGSPGLAMSLLGNLVNEFIFFDLETESLADIEKFAVKNNLQRKVRTICQDSIVGGMDILPSLSKNTLIHIDPYGIDQLSTNGFHYLDVFVKASERGIKSFLWYGFNTLEEKEQLNDFIRTNLKKSLSGDYSCTELIMDSIQKDTILCNPGIVGSGLLTSNISKNSLSLIQDYSKSLVELYKGTTYQGIRGDLFCENVVLK